MPVVIGFATPREIVQGAGRDCAAAAAAAALTASDPAWPTRCVFDAQDAFVRTRLFSANAHGKLTPKTYTVKRSRAKPWRSAAPWWRCVERALAVRGWESGMRMAPRGAALSHDEACAYGFPNVYFEVFTGKRATLVSCEGMSTSALIRRLSDALARKEPVCLSTLPRRFTSVRQRGGLVSEHCYAVTKVRRQGASWEVQLYDPRGATLWRLGRVQVPVVLHCLRRSFWLNIEQVQQNCAALYVLEAHA